MHFVHFAKSAEFSDNFDSNIGAHRFVNTEKFTFEVDDLRKRRRKRAAMMTRRVFYVVFVDRRLQR